VTNFTIITPSFFSDLKPVNGDQIRWVREGCLARGGRVRSITALTMKVDSNYCGFRYGSEWVGAELPMDCMPAGFYCSEEMCEAVEILQRRMEKW
jgi:hypothetical protein